MKFMTLRTPEGVIYTTSMTLGKKLTPQNFFNRAGHIGAHGSDGGRQDLKALRTLKITRTGRYRGVDR